VRPVIGLLLIFALGTQANSVSIGGAPALATTNLSRPERDAQRAVHHHLVWLADLAAGIWPADGGKAFFEKYGSVPVLENSSKRTVLRSFYEQELFNRYSDSPGTQPLRFHCGRPLRIDGDAYQLTCSMTFSSKDNVQEKHVLNFRVKGGELQAVVLSDGNTND
jgi:hypothetical protein